jgi:hypothetical protein
LVDSVVTVCALTAPTDSSTTTTADATSWRGCCVIAVPLFRELTKITISSSCPFVRQTAAADVNPGSES